MARTDYPIGKLEAEIARLKAELAEAYKLLRDWQDVVVMQTHGLNGDYRLVYDKSLYQMDDRTEKFLKFEEG